MRPAASIVAAFFLVVGCSAGPQPIGLWREADVADPLSMWIDSDGDVLVLNADGSVSGYGSIDWRRGTLTFQVIDPAAVILRHTTPPVVKAVADGGETLTLTTSAEGGETRQRFQCVWRDVMEVQ